MTRILIVDDEPIVLQGICSIDWNKYDIETIGTAVNGREAMAQCLAHTPDIVLSDIKMPVEDGLTFAEKIQKLYPDILVILFTGYNDEPSMLRAIRAKIFDYLIKPVRTEEIIEVVLRAKEAVELNAKSKLLNDRNAQLISDNLYHLQTLLIMQLINENAHTDILKIKKMPHSSIWS